MPKKTTHKKEKTICVSKLITIQNLVNSINLESTNIEVESTIDSIRACCGSNSDIQNWADLLIAKKCFDLTILEATNCITQIETFDERFPLGEDAIEEDNLI